MAILAFLSQKGGVGKSTLARAFACEAAKSGLSVKLADLDTQQGTSTDWHRQRQNNGYDPVGSVEVFGKVAHALKTADHFDLLIVDGSPRASSGVLEVAKKADLIVLPTGASRDDLRPTLLLAYELEKKKVPLERFAIALMRVMSEAEIREAKQFIQRAGFKVLDGYIPEKPAYRQAQNEGLSITETRYASLNEKAEVLMTAIGEQLQDG